MALTEDYHYELPPASIAQHPVAQRDESRLLVMERAAHAIHHTRFRNLAALLAPGDLLVVNDSRVIPARCRAVKLAAIHPDKPKPSRGQISRDTCKVDVSGEDAVTPRVTLRSETRNQVLPARLEVLAVEEVNPETWWVMLKPGKRVRAGTRIQLLDAAHQLAPVFGRVMDKSAEGLYLIQFSAHLPFRKILEEIGEIPLPPYIQPAGRDQTEDRDRYQTVYAQVPGSIAAPTAGLHFTPSLLARLTERGIGVTHITLHVGLGTFAPVKTERVDNHLMHVEHFDIPADTVERIATTRSNRRRVIAVGTTTLRALESATDDHGQLRPGPQSTRLFVRPPWKFRQADALITNFHLPCSTLLMLVSAFADPESERGREWILDTYRQAIAEGYRFYSYGDAMLIL